MSRQQVFSLLLDVMLFCGLSLCFLGPLVAGCVLGFFVAPWFCGVGVWSCFWPLCFGEKQE